MRRLQKTLLAATIAFLPLASYAASQNIGVVDVQKALLESQAAESYAKSSQKTFQPKLDALASERDQIKSREDKLKKNALTLSKTELKKQEDSLDKDKQAFLQKLQTLRQEKEQADQNELKRLEPKLQDAISNVAQKDHYSLILDKSAVVYQKGNTDLTPKVIAQLNKITQQADDKKSAKK